MTKGIERVREFLKSNGTNARIVEFEESTKNSQLAAQALGCTIGEIAKAVVFTGDQTAVIVLSGEKRVDAEKLTRVTGGRMRVASAEEVKRFTGYVAGGVPPFPHDNGIRVYPDASLTRYAKVWAAAGEQKAVMQLSVDELVRTLGTGIVDVSS